MNDLEHLELPDPETVTQAYYYADGSVVINNKTKKMQVCAKTLTHKDSGNITYYIMCGNGSTMYNPFDTYLTGNQNVWKFRKVNRTVFDTYIKFLNTNYKSLLYQAERGL